MNGLSIIIPVYNEHGAIKDVLIKLRSILQQLDAQFPYEIIVVDDGSIDGTGDEIKNLDFIRLFTHPRNRGYGAAIKTGIKQVKYDTIGITDADSTYPNEEIINLVRVMNEKNLDMVVGARTGSKACIPLIRRPAKWFITQLAIYLTETKIPDLNSGLRLMRKSIVEKFVPLLPDGFSLTSTITIAMLSNGYLVEYIPINYSHRIGKSKIRPIHDTLNFIQLIIRTVLYFNPLKIFLPLSLPPVFCGIILILFQAIVFQDISTVSVIISLGGIQLLAIGMLADLIVKRT
jgi:glycosyltransferase involved in cell wall biosynthesis